MCLEKTSNKIQRRIMHTGYAGKFQDPRPKIQEISKNKIKKKNKNDDQDQVGARKDEGKRIKREEDHMRASPLTRMTI